MQTQLARGRTHWGPSSRKPDRTSTGHPSAFAARPRRPYAVVVESTTHTVHPDEAGRRLDRFLRKALPQAALGEIFKLLRTSRIRLNGKKAKPESRLGADDEVELRIHPEELRRLGWADPGAGMGGRAGGGRPETQTGRIGGASVPTKGGRAKRREAPPLVYRGDQLLVLAKPAGLATQGGTDQGDEHIVALLPEWLGQWQVRSGSRTFQPAPAHRLDKGTSGCLAIGLSASGMAALVAGFRDHQIRKTYLALVEEQGTTLPDTGVCDAPLLTRSKPGARRPRTVVDPEGKPAVTEWTVLARGPLDTSRNSRERYGCLLQLRPHTGRNHQIRAHCAHLGAPLIGDPRYGGPHDPQARSGPGGGRTREYGTHASGHSTGMPYLHAHALEMPAVLLDSNGSDEGTTVRVEAPLPSRWQRLVPWLP